VIKKTLKKRPASRRSMKHGTSKDARSNATWLWAAVAVGKGQQLWTHPNGLKRFTYRVLPYKGDAKNIKPRGLEEIQDTIQARVAKDSFLVFDKWRATVTAVKRLGYKHAPPVNHSVEWVEKSHGFHTNDIESENQRLKHWNRTRYGKLMLNQFELDEYMYYMNYGHSMDKIMFGLAVASGGKCINNPL